MGTYLYTARVNKKEIYNILIDSSIEKVYHLEYACKPFWGWEGYDSYTKRIISKCKATWRGKDIPKFFHTSFYKDEDTGIESAAVYKNVHNIVCWFDSDEKAIEYVGRIIKNPGKKFSFRFEPKPDIQLEASI